MKVWFGYNTVINRVSKFVTDVEPLPKSYGGHYMTNKGASPHYEEVLWSMEWVETLEESSSDVFSDTWKFTEYHDDF